MGYRDVRVKESRVCTGVVSTGLKGNKQHEIITIWGNRVGVLLQVSALHYSARSWVSEGFQTVASAHVLHNLLFRVQVFL